jgi:3-demethylubiquinone-9 3-methyltransferase
MARSVAPFLMFEGSAEATMNFYVTLFRNSGVQRIERYGPGEPGKEGSVKRADFMIAGQNLICIDSPIHHAFSFTPSVSLFVECGPKSSSIPCSAGSPRAGRCSCRRPATGSVRSSPGSTTASECLGNSTCNEPTDAEQSLHRTRGHEGSSRFDGIAAPAPASGGVRAVRRRSPGASAGCGCRTARRCRPRSAPARAAARSARSAR